MSAAPLDRSVRSHRARRAAPSAPLALGALLLLPVAPLAAQAGEATTGTVAGRVTAEGAPAQGASVALTAAGAAPRGALVRADGRYRITAPPGRYALRVRLIGYAPRTDSVTVTAGGSVTRDVALERAATTLDAVAVVGTRGAERSVQSAPVPVDVLPAAEIRATGRTETAQMIQAVAPSFNFPRTTLGDGTDHVRPATLRGLAPDQVLVLVNGKRRHASALVNVNGFVGRGSQAVDLNAIPASLIERIEILRDGAAAQYGSDAIAGVINVVLKANAPGELTSQVGETREGDGRLFQANAGKGFTFGQDGFLFVGGEVRDRGRTNRAGGDTRAQYFPGDPRNDDANLPAPGRVTFRFGDAYTHDTQGFLNFGKTLGAVQTYAFAGAGRRFGDAAGFFRRPLDDNNVRQLYPNGFLPSIQSRIVDLSGVAGVKGTTLGWSWDASAGYGRNTFDYTVDHTVNVSLGAASPTRFDAGRLASDQLTANLDLFRDVRVGLPAPLHAAWGAEWRRDGYAITAGEPASYAQGTAPIYDAQGNPTTRPAAVGSQGFPGYRPQDAGRYHRQNVAGYVDLSTDLSRQLLVGVAGRAERYSDFGSTATGKVSARWEPVAGAALRGALSTGFRAPTLGQQHYASTSISFVGSPLVPLEIRTFPASSAEAALLNARPLKPERSTNASIGVALAPGHGLALTADVYDIGLRDRIVLSNNFTGTDVLTALQDAGVTGVQGGRYFTNAVDTRTRGVDVVANWGATLAPRTDLRLTAGLNANRTRVTRVDTSTVLGGHSDQLFSRVDRARLEVGQPRNNLILSGTLTRGRVGLTARTQRFGQVTSFSSAATGANDQTFGARWISDASVSWTSAGRTTVTLGADNLFDVYPDRTLPQNSNSGVLQYSAISPFGFNGRFAYARVSLGF